MACACACHKDTELEESFIRLIFAETGLKRHALSIAWVTADVACCMHLRDWLLSALAGFRGLFSAWDKDCAIAASCCPAESANTLLMAVCRLESAALYRLEKPHSIVGAAYEHSETFYLQHLDTSYLLVSVRVVRSIARLPWISNIHKDYLFFERAGKQTSSIGQ